MQRAPFSRFAALMSAVGALMSTLAMPLATAVEQAGGYKSRGKGKGGGNRRAPGANMAFIRKARKARNKCK